MPQPALPKVRYKPNVHAIQAAVDKVSAKLEQQLENNSEGEVLVHNATIVRHQQADN